MSEKIIRKGRAREEGSGSKIDLLGELSAKSNASELVSDWVAKNAAGLQVCTAGQNLGSETVNKRSVFNNILLILLIRLFEFDVYLNFQIS